MKLFTLKSKPHSYWSAEYMILADDEKSMKAIANKNDIDIKDFTWREEELKSGIIYAYNYSPDGY